MGMFKDIREMQKTAKQYERPKLRDGVKQASEMIEQAQAQQQLAQHLAENGADGQAMIRALEATGTYINQMPEMRLELSVDVNGFESDVTHVQPISPAVLPQLQPGATVACRVDPGDHSKLVI